MFSSLLLLLLLLPCVLRKKSSIIELPDNRKGDRHHCIVIGIDAGENSVNMSGPKQAGGAEFSVTIVACGPIAGGTSLVYAVTVTQPVQSWTVVRSHEDFGSLGVALATTSTGILDPSLSTCPTLTTKTTSISTGDLNTIVQVRNELQAWLSSVLMNPSAHESPAVNNFLTAGANTIPPQYEGVVWTQFSPVLPPVSPPPGSPIAAANISAGSSNNMNNPAAGAGNNNVYDMEMDEMYDIADDENATSSQQDDQDEDDQDFIPAASVRYKQTNEAITDEDEMEIMQAGEVEMIDDIGSLAQSLGASHLGRSLQLQAEMKHHGNNNNIGSNNAHHFGRAGGGMPNKPQQGLNIGRSVVQPAPAMGGIGGAMAQAANSSLPFNHKPPVSAPKLDSFKMIKVIGKGSFGKVFLVKEIKTGEIYALKVLRKDNIIKRNQVEHTNTERSVLGYVKHPFIVGMNMAFQSKDKLYFVLDYCAGGELFFHLGKLGKFPELRARFYAAEIILAISYVHSLDIIYRDLKPENVLLDAKGHIRLTDFGLSKEGISNSSSGANSFCGTPEYLAPEILNRQGHGRAVDWWSLGALLYEMITGLPPFYCQDRERLFEKIRKSELHYPPSVSKPAKKLLLGLLTKDPTRRLGSGPKDAEEIKQKEFFADLDFNRLMKGEIPPPWKPDISGSLDTSQFDKEFTRMPVFSPQSMQRMHGFGATPDDNPFEGFTFTDRRLHGPGTQAGI